MPKTITIANRKVEMTEQAVGRYAFNYKGWYIWVEGYSIIAIKNREELYAESLEQMVMQIDRKESEKNA